MQTPGVQILVVDDEAEIRTLLRRCFEREGFQVLEAKDGTEFRARIEQAPISLITLDLTLGGEDGLELAREIRAKCNIPIIMITGKGDTIDRVVGLELGADDYISKPFQLREVLARVRAVLRRYGATEAAPAQAATADRALCVRGLGSGHNEAGARPQSRRTAGNHDRRVQPARYLCPATSPRALARQHHGSAQGA